MPESKKYNYASEKLPFVLFDGFEDKVLGNYCLSCKTCGQKICLEIKDFNKKTKLPYFSRKVHNDCLDKEFAQVIKYKNNHYNYIRYSFYEKQPMRYILELTKFVAVKKPTSQRIAEWLLVAVLLLILPVAFTWIHYSFISEYNLRKNIEQNGQATSAKILHSYHSGGGYKNVDRYEITYEYMVENQRYESTTQVDYSTYASFKDSKNAQILYLPSNPKQSDFMVNDQLALDIFVIVLLDTAILGAVGFVAVKAILIKKKKR